MILRERPQRAEKAAPKSWPVRSGAGNDAAPIPFLTGIAAFAGPILTPERQES